MAQYLNKTKNNRSKIFDNTPHLFKGIEMSSLEITNQYLLSEVAIFWKDNITTQGNDLFCIYIHANKEIRSNRTEIESWFYDK